MKFSMVDTGSVGLVSRRCLVETVVNVTCVDVNKDKVYQDIVLLCKPGLEPLTKRMVEKEHLVFSTSLAQGVNGADAALIGLGPLPHEDESADAMLCLTQWTEFHRAK